MHRALLSAAAGTLVSEVRLTSRSIFNPPTPTPAHLSIHFSFAVCDSEPGLSSMERKDKLAKLYEGEEDNFLVGDTVFTDDSRACYLVSARIEIFRKMLEAEEVDLIDEYLEVQPAIPSMKMLEGMTEAIQKRLDGEDEISVTDGRVVTNLNFEEDETLGLALSFCPVITHFLEKGITYKELIAHVKEFMTNGDTVTNMDFFYTAPEEYGEVPDAMKFWSDVLRNVTDTDGGKLCYDQIITKDLDFEPSSSNKTVVAYFPYVNGSLLGEDDMCSWYIVRSLALHPYICRIDLEVMPKILSDDDDEDSSANSLPTNLGLLVSSVVLSLMMLML